MHTRINFVFLIASLILIAGIYGCGTPASNFFILTPDNDYEPRSTGTESHIGIGIGNIELPDYLRKPQIVTYSKNNEITFDEYNRWAEPLDENITRILTENLAAMIPTNNIYLFMWPKEDPNIFQISISIDRFGLLPDSNVVLNTRWSITGSNKKSLLLTEKSEYKEKAVSLDYGHISSIMSNLIGKLSEDIASEIKRQAEKI
ncbi:hypothetical protein MNBD_IGNAVI01-431 [hydrothermal vent metagenome]|uniref:ABC-type transport auxiliary lipoprotein component domain-containing protein n=1 Tax=hydrothermal vent metagenome TaxID=652676 RepID=A0A3B1BLN9_9ZZZZ